MNSKVKLQLIRSSVLLILSLFSSSIFAAHALPEFNARYAVSKFGIKLAEARYQLFYTDTGYKITQNTDLYGIAVYFSNYAVAAYSYVDVKDDHLLLKKHSYILSGSDEDKDEDFDITWDKSEGKLSGSVTGVVRGQDINLTLDTETWDLLSFQIPLMIEANKNVKDYPYNALLIGEVDNYIFEFTETKNVTFSNKQYTALKMVCKDKNRNRQLHVWLLPELYNIPVVIENYRDDRIHFRGKLESVSFNNKEFYTNQEAETEAEQEIDNDF